ncbi:MAG: hypothetical protein HY270_06250, partial [Deltaproteobacteria bacterium]|nr:hypothetical protein [Deltaproteobacteria bacterium]
CSSSLATLLPAMSGNLYSISPNLPVVVDGFFPNNPAPPFLYGVLLPGRLDYYCPGGPSNCVVPRILGDAISVLLDTQPDVAFSSLGSQHFMLVIDGVDAFNTPSGPAEAVASNAGGLLFRELKDALDQDQINGNPPSAVAKYSFLYNSVATTCASWTVVSARALERNPGGVLAQAIAAAYPNTTPVQGGPDSLCGNCVLSPGETCDDGNIASSDGCSGSCQVESCFACTDTPSSCTPAVGSACASDGNPCTLDQCDGTANCTHPPGNAGTECRAAAGLCDVAETCSGTDPACPNDAFLPSSTVCRAATDICDAAENCSGASAACPADALAASGTVCRSAVGPCDNAEQCTGTSAACPPDSLLPNTAVCRPAAGSCDVAENCTGSSATCPSDTLKPSGTACTSDGNVCTDDKCNGSSVTCQHINNTAPCNNGDGCPADTCSGGVCVPVSCPSADAVIYAGKPLNVSISSGATSVAKTVAITVRNADVVDRTIALSVDASGCPMGVAGLPDFVPSTPVADTSILVPAGKTKKAKLPLTINSTDFTSFNFKAPTRCTLLVSASDVIAGGNNDPSPANNVAAVEINVIDKNDPEHSTTTVHESVVKSANPTKINIGLTKPSATKTLSATLENADYTPTAESPGDVISLNASTTCPGLMLGAPVCDSTTMSSSATVKGGATKTCKVTATADGNQIFISNKLSPLRCTVTFTATGPSPQVAPLDPSNNSTELVIDVLDKND